MEQYQWNEGWYFTPDFTPELCQPDFVPAAGQAYEAVRLPHTVKMLPYNYCSEADYQMVSGYRREWEAPAAWRGKRVLLTFDAVAHDAVVYCNGAEVAHHACGYTAFTADLSAHLVYGGKNVIAVRCDSRETLDVPPFGKVIDYMTYGGIYRAVRLEVRDSVSLDDVFLTAAGDGGFHLYASVTGESVGCLLQLEIRDSTGRAMGYYQGSAGAPLSGTVAGVTPWGPDSPVLYTAAISLLRPGTGGLPDRVLDQRRLRIGFRTIDFRTDGLYLNGRKLRLRGLDRHQSWPYAGYAMPDSQQRLDAVRLRCELGCNAVRTSHYPQSQAFVDACDELGLLVFTEIPGWQHIGGPAWQEQAVQNCREMVQQYRNHPSIFLWGVRINESADDDALYRRTNEAAHRLDPTRPTGGVRNFKHSHCLEDVYTYNDFLHRGDNPGCEPKRAVTSDPRKGYLISEYCGHMFPTKTFDWEEKRLEHALRYARVAADAAAQPDIAGCFGWCMFDYNTHRDFGSGDRICYHGVMDMYRNEKLTAAVFASQKPLRTPGDAVLEISSTMDIGEHPAGALGEVWAFTNAESVRLYKNDEFVAEFFPDRRGVYAALDHPPICISDIIGCLLERHEGYPHALAEEIKECVLAIGKYGQSGLPAKYAAKVAKLMAINHLTPEDGMRLYGEYVGNWGGHALHWRFDAMAGGQAVRSVTCEPVEHIALQAVADNPVLTDGPTWDCAAVRLRAVDQNGNTLPFCLAPVQLTLEGPAHLLGPSCVPLRGGLGGTYVVTEGTAGAVTLTCTMDNAPPVRVALTVRRRED